MPIKNFLNYPRFVVKLLQWLKTFLKENPSETVILDIASDDGDNNPTVESFVYDFYKQQAENPRAEYPEIYVGDHVPTLGEARGRLKALKSYEPDPFKSPKIRGLVPYYSCVSCQNYV